MASAILPGEASTSTASTSRDADALDLLQRLQHAIFSGQPQTAADVASELAKMKANCSMSIRRSEIQLVDVEVAKEPIRVPVEPTTTISDLETQIYLKHKVPIRGRCVVLLETTLPSQENHDGAASVAGGTSSDGMELSTNAVDLTNGTAMDSEIAPVEWACKACTFINEPNDSYCLMCETSRVPQPNVEADSSEPEIISLLGSSSDDEFLAPIDETFSNYQELLSMEQTDLITNLEAFECPICEDVFHPGDGVILKTCLHHFCKECLKKVIESSSRAEIKCPYTVGYSCDQFLQDREIRALLSAESFARYLQVCMNQAESKTANAFHCKTPHCLGWCEFDNDADVFTCPACMRNNCLACEAIHDGLNCAQYQKKIQTETAKDAPVPNVVANSVEEHYLKIMKLRLYDTYDMIDEDEVLGLRFNVAYHYEGRLKADVGKNRPSLMKRLGQEAVSLSTALPLSFKSSVFVRCDTDRLVVMKAMITGPAETPYANGCFEFDVYFPPNYPNTPILINFQTTGRHTIRFNPNLYNDGKVCLSLLNTWHGRPEEQWNPRVSTCLQALVSIQSLILVPDPYFNEPGYERSRNTDHGRKRSREYNFNIMKATVRWAMLEQIRNPPPCFQDVIRYHFWLKRNEITNQITNWINEMENGTSKKRRLHSQGGSVSLKRDFKLLCDEFAKLETPPGCEELSTLPQFTYKAPTFPAWISATTQASTGAPSTSTGPMYMGPTSSYPYGPFHMGAASASALLMGPTTMSTLPNVFPMGVYPPSATSLSAYSHVTSSMGSLMNGLSSVSACPTLVNGVSSASTFPNGASSLGALPNGASPMSAFLNSASTMGTLPNGASPAGAFPNSASTLGAMPNSVSSMGAFSNSASSVGAFPQGASSVSAFPSSTSSVGAFLNSASSVGAFPNSAPLAGAFPNGASSVGGYSMGASSLNVPSTSGASTSSFNPFF